MSCQEASARQGRLPATKTAGKKTEGNDLLRDKCQNTEFVKDLSNNKTFVNKKIGPSTSTTSSGQASSGQAARPEDGG